MINCRCSQTVLHIRHDATERLRSMQINVCSVGYVLSAIGSTHIRLGGCCVPPRLRALAHTREHTGAQNRTHKPTTVVDYNFGYFSIRVVGCKLKMKTDHNINITQTTMMFFVLASLYETIAQKFCRLTKRVIHEYFVRKCAKTTYNYREDRQTSADINSKNGN